MAAATTKEQLASIAFAYFMVDQNYKNNQAHLDSWIDLFENYKVTDVREKYKTYVEPNFKFGSLKTQYGFKTGSGDAHLYIVYNQIKELFDSGFIDPSKEYRVFGQNSVFSKLVKDKCLTKIGQSFSGILSERAKLVDLSPADFFIVNYDKTTYDRIEKDFKKNIIQSTSSTILKNFREDNPDSYVNLIKKYFISKDLIPVSHKMASSKNHNTSVKLSGDISNMSQARTNKKYIDPYSQLLISLTGKTTTQIEKLLDNIIEIDYSRWDIREDVSSATWALYFKLNYKKLDPNFSIDVFGLKPLPGTGSGSWNGKFHFQDLRSKTPWVAGMAPASIKPFLESYSQYNRIMTLFGKKRVKVLNKVLYDIIYSKTKNRTKANEEFSLVETNTRYTALVEFLENKEFHSFSELSKKMEAFLKEVSYPTLFKKYQEQIIKEIRSEGQFTTNLSKINADRLKEHYISLQMAYFLFHGGQQFRLYVKKKIFVTIFGAISKRGFVKITDTGVKHLISKEFSGDKSTMKSPPHLILL